MTDPLTPSQRRVLLAGDFVLGLLDDAQQIEALRLLQEDARFSEDVEQWEAEFGTWLAASSDVQVPSAQMWQRIAATSGQTSRAGAEVVGHAAARWRITALAAGIAALVFAFMWQAALHPQASPTRTQIASTPPAQLSIAQIENAGEKRIVALAYDRASGRLVVRVSSLETNGSVPELWLIGSDGKPQSLGIRLPGQAYSTILAPRLRRLFADGATIAISLEPDAEGKHIAPAGPIVGSTKISAI